VVGSRRIWVQTRLTVAAKRRINPSIFYHSPTNLGGNAREEARSVSLIEAFIAGAVRLDGLLQLGRVGHVGVTMGDSRKSLNAAHERRKRGAT
jgi:hypothetical protein